MRARPSCVWYSGVSKSRGSDEGAAEAVVANVKAIKKGSRPIHAPNHLTAAANLRRRGMSISSGIQAGPHSYAFDGIAASRTVSTKVGKIPVAKRPQPPQ